MFSYADIKKLFRETAGPAVKPPLLSPSWLPSAPVLRAALTVALALLTSLLIFAFGQRSLDAWLAHLNARDVQVLDKATNQFSTGLLELLMEQLHTNNALQASDPAEANVLREISLRRQRIREHYDPGLAVLAGQSFPGRDALLDRLMLALAEMNERRAAADSALALPRERRDETTYRTLVSAVTHAVSASLSLWFVALHAEAAADPTLAYLAVIKEIGWRLRETAGQERAHIAAAIAAGAPLTPQQRKETATARAQVDLLWSQLEHLATGLGDTFEIRAAMTRARQIYFTQFRLLADEIADDGDEDPALYPPDASRWVTVTTPQIDTLLGVLYAAARASEARTASLRRETRGTLIASLLLLTVGIVTAGGTLTVALSLVTLLVRRADAQEELARQAEEAAAEARQANASKSVFLANMSHELRTPLNAIIGFTELIALYLRQSSAPPAQLGFSADILASSQTLLDLINDILDTTRAESNSLRIQDEIVDVVALTESAVRVTSSAQSASRLTLTADISPDLPLLVGDARRIKKIVMNLVSNALKFTPAAGHVCASACLTDGSITLSVRDTGIGMSADEIKLALQPFRQIDAGLARLYPGAGLGLPLAKALANLHGARLDLDSAPGEGTCVRVTFPPERTWRPALAG